MRKISKPEKEIIAAIKVADQLIENIKETFKANEKQIESYTEKYGDKEKI